MKREESQISQQFNEHFWKIAMKNMSFNLISHMRYVLLHGLTYQSELFTLNELINEFLTLDIKNANMKS